MAAFERLIRFEAEDGKTYYGDLGAEVSTREIPGRVVKVVTGDVESGFTKTDQEAKVSKVQNSPSNETQNETKTTSSTNGIHSSSAPCPPPTSSCASA